VIGSCVNPPAPLRLSRRSPSACRCGQLLGRPARRDWLKVLLPMRVSPMRGGVSSGLQRVSRKEYARGAPRILIFPITWKLSGSRGLLRNSWTARKHCCIGPCNGPRNVCGRRCGFGRKRLTQIGTQPIGLEEIVESSLAGFAVIPGGIYYSDAKSWTNAIARTWSAKY
jgi:hypothetical protein